MELKTATALLRISGLVALMAGLGACSSNAEDSTDVATSDIYLKVELREKSGANSTRVTANFYDGNIAGGSIELVEGEYITVRHGDQEVRLKKDKELLQIDYDGHFTTTPAGGLFSITLHRANGESHNFDIEMPSSFTVTSPSAGEVFHEDSEIELQWEPALSSASINVHGHLACESVEDGFEFDIDNENETWMAPDIGVFPLPIDLLAASMRRELSLEDEELLTGSPCELDLEVYRENRLSLAGDFAEGSTITATKTATIGDMALLIGAD